MASPPWAGVASHEQYYVLLTGANSGVGLGIGQRVIDEFLASRSLSSHLILIPTTRSANKSRETVRALRSHLEKTARTSKRLRARAGADYDPQTAIARVHVFSIQLDLCSLRSVYDAAERLVHGKLSDPTGLIDDVRIPRLDAVLFNAGIGGWSGLNWPKLVRQFLAVGLKQSTTYPVFKDALPAAVLDTQKMLADAGVHETKAPPPPDLAEVFCANLFGHYVFAHELLPLLSRATPSEAPGRVVWTSTIDAGREHLSFADFQAARYQPPYESSKRITDLLSLTAELPSVQPVSATYFASSPASASRPVKPHLYVSHPGVVCTYLFPLNWFLYFCYFCAMHVAWLRGSPWHVVTPYLGACAPAWLALASSDELDAQGAQRVKWGSSSPECGRAAPKKTEVEGWGWEGRVEDENSDDAHLPNALRKSKGRKWDAVAPTEECLAKFEDDGRRCWAELERLRIAWEAALGKAK
ncbi:hypothetical protein F4779DRAFT_214408 [Xylariaceae sp. FL0662B]|nr:hypothetical protein F4779DRAFT_214408 [Xylariaceae sp. FL0662B]